MSESNADSLGYNPLLSRFFLSPEEKLNKEKGKAIVKQFYSQQTSNDTNLNFFKRRNAEWIKWILWAKGSQPMNEFLDYMNVVDGNKAWVNLDLTPTRIAPQFIGTLVESMAKTKTYPCVKAIDDGSVDEKQNRLLEALFRMANAQEIDQIQQKSGVQVEPIGVYVPDDEMSARVYFELEDRLPKEIRFEEMLNKLQNDIKFERVLNRKTIYDLICLNCVVTKIEKVSDRQYTIKRCIPTNMIYNFFMNDNGDCEVTQIGEFYNLKVKDFRSKFGKSEKNPDGLSEKEVFELAKLSSNKNIGSFNYMWNDNWALLTYNQNRPYDDCSILVLDCEIDFCEEQYYTSKKDVFGKDNIQAKKGIPYQQKTKEGKIIEQSKPEDVEVIKKSKNTWMRGVYAPYGDVMLYWGKPDIIITPYTNVSKPLSSYSINIPNNDGEFIPSLVGRIMEPLTEYQLVKLKRKQLIAKIKPSGIRIDIETAKNLELGTGESISWEEVIRIYEQTGNEIWSSKGVDPLVPQASPLGNTVVDKSINDIIGLTNILAGIVNEIRQLIGVPQYRDGSDVGDRTSGVLQEQQNVSSYNVTDFIVNSNNQVWEESFYKVCLLHWNDIVKEEPESKDDMINTRFDVTVKMKSTEYQKQLLEQDIQRYSQVIDANGNPAISPKDAMMLREIDDPKLAQWYLSTTIEQNRKKSKEDKSRAIQETAQVQQQSLQQSAENEQAILQQKMMAEKGMLEFKTQKDKEIELLKGILTISSKGSELPAYLMPLVQQLVPNILIPLNEENKQMQQQLSLQEEAKNQEMAGEQSGQQESPEQENQEQPQEEPQQEMQEQPMQ